MVRTDATADDSLAAMRARSKFGIAIAAMIRMIATTISSSISEKPFCFRISKFPLVLIVILVTLRTSQPYSMFASASPKPPVTLVSGTFGPRALFSDGVQTLGRMGTCAPQDMAGKNRRGG